MFTLSGKLQENDQVNKVFTSVTRCRKTAGEHYVFIAFIVTNYHSPLEKLHEKTMFNRRGKLKENDQENKQFTSLLQCGKTACEHYVFMVFTVTNY